MVQKKAPVNVANGQKRESANMSFQKKDLSARADAKGQNGNVSGFRTDSAISSGRLSGERVLQRWVDSSSPTKFESLESPNNNGPWDQFRANERLFGLKTDYDENIYTTQIDKSHPQYRERAAAAEKMAREIERSTPTTAHVAEERIMDHVGGNDRGGDEEEKYSGVKRQDFPPLPDRGENKYTPPARRAPTSSTTVKGAPVDPAIISSQLKSQKVQAASKAEDSKARATPNVAAAETSPSRTPAPKTQTPEPKVEAKFESQQKSADKAIESKTLHQTATPLRPSAATSRTISPQAKDGAAPSATSTVERDVLKEFKTFANQQRMNADKIRSNKAKADKEVKLIELKKFAASFKLSTPVPKDLISIIAKDPAKQKEIQEKAVRDAQEVAKRKAEEGPSKDKKPTTTTNNAQTTATTQGATPDRSRPAVSTATTQPPAATARHNVNGRQSYFQPQFTPFQNSRAGLQHMPRNGPQNGYNNRIRNIEAQRMGPEMRQPPTGPANANRMSNVPSHMGVKLNPSSTEFRPSVFAPAFSPTQPSAGSSPRSMINNEIPSGPGSTNGLALIVITKKRKAVDPKKCVILAHIKSLPVPQGRNWDDNEGIKPSFDTPPTWRQATDDEKPESTMRLSYVEYFERQPFATQPTPNPAHVMPHLAHQHQLPFHLQHGAQHMGPRHSPHVPQMQMHSGPHGPPHVPYNGADDHRMVHSSSQQSFNSPRMSQVPMYAPNMGSPAQMPYGQNVMPPSFMPNAPQMNQFPRSFSNNGQYMPQQQMPMGPPMVMNPQFMAPQGMGGPQMQMYPGPFMPPGGAAPQPIPGANGYPSPGRPAAPLMMHQGSQPGQPVYTMSPGMQYQQPYQQPGQMNNMRGYSNPGPQQFGTSPQMHQYGPRNGNNFKNYQGHVQHQGPQGGHPIPTGPQGRTADGPEEAK